jgi:hypothetical protein
MTIGWYSNAYQKNVWDIILRFVDKLTRGE